MAEKDYTVEGRQFFTERDYARAKRDKKLIDELRQETDFRDRRELEQLRRELREGRYRFLTILGRDFLEEVEEILKKTSETGSKGKNTRHKGAAKAAKERGPGKKQENSKQRPERRTGREGSLASGEKYQVQKQNSRAEERKNTLESRKLPKDSKMDALVAGELKKRDRRRKLIIAACSMVALCCLGYFGMYSYYNYRTDRNYQELIALKEKPVSSVVAAEKYVLNGVLSGEKRVSRYMR